VQSATTGITIQNAGSGNAHALLQPTIIVNYLLRVL
jgi:microcystin-dependent protein